MRRRSWIRSLAAVLTLVQLAACAPRVIVPVTQEPRFGPVQRYEPVGLEAGAWAEIELYDGRRTEGRVERWDDLSITLSRTEGSVTVEFARVRTLRAGERRPHFIFALAGVVAVGYVVAGLIVGDVVASSGN